MYHVVLGKNSVVDLEIPRNWFQQIHKNRVQNIFKTLQKPYLVASSRNHVTVNTTGLSLVFPNFTRNQVATNLQCSLWHFLPILFILLTLAIFLNVSN